MAIGMGMTIDFVLKQYADDAPKDKDETLSDGGEEPHMAATTTENRQCSLVREHSSVSERGTKTSTSEEFIDEGPASSIGLPFYDDIAQCWGSPRSIECQGSESSHDVDHIDLSLYRDV